MMTTLPRAERLPVRVSIMYRVPGDEHWFNGRTLNISETGVLFGPTDLQPGYPVEVIFSTPVQIGSIGSGKVACVGEVVRTTEAGSAGARFEECRYVLE